jgi:predicted DNA-binding mobile mystery protein A
MREILRVGAQRELDRTARSYLMARRVNRPRGGWLRAVRKALGLRAVDMAVDLKVTPSMVFQLERSEWENTITLRRLDEVARIMECQLVYAIVPREGKFEDHGLLWAMRVMRAQKYGWKR